MEIVLIFLQAPRALFAGVFEPDKTGIIRGWPARVVGFLLLFIGLSPFVDIAIILAFDISPLPPVYLAARLASFFACVILAAFICVIFRQKKTDVSQFAARRNQVPPHTNTPSPQDNEASGPKSGEPNGPLAKPWQGPRS